MYKYILFDFDGTIFDTVEGITKSVRYAINKYGIDRELHELRCFAGPPLVDKFMEVFGFDRDRAEEATRSFKERYAPIGINECAIFPGIKELLIKLREQGFVLGIATSKPQHLAEKLLQGEDMIKLFDLICGSGGVGNNDTKESVLNRALETFGAEKELAVLVGDTKYDVHGAKACGIDCIGVRYGYAAPGELEEAGAKYIVEDVPELEKLLSEGI